MSLPENKSDQLYRGAGEGPGWKVERGLITPELAVSAGRQAVLLCALFKEGAVPFASKHRVEDKSVRIVLAVDASHRSFRGSLTSLLEAYEGVAETVESSPDTFYLDFHTEPVRGKMRSGKINPAAETSRTVGLVGESGIKIETPDPVTGEDKFWLGPADGIRLDHTVRDRPRHATWNLSVNTRVDLIVEAGQPQ